MVGWISQIYTESAVHEFGSHLAGFFSFQFLTTQLEACLINIKIVMHSQWSNDKIYEL